jgi:parvulin-like peptidyl-prolyl isomerase
MKRFVAAGFVALAAVAGCGQTSEFIASDEPTAPGPVGHVALPSIHQSINSGLPAQPTPSKPAHLVRTETTEPQSYPELKQSIAVEAPPSVASSDRVSATIHHEQTSEATPVELPPIEEPAESAPVELPLNMPAEATTPPVAPMDDVPSAAPPLDQMVSPTSTSPTESDQPTGKHLGEWAARVNDDIITLNELQTAAKERTSQLPAEERDQPEIRNMLITSVLDNLIDRVLILQHARRNELKNPKGWDFFTKEADKIFDREKLPVLQKKYDATDRYELERKMSEKGLSLQEARASFRSEFIARQYLVMKVAPKVHVDLPEMRAYYQEHQDHEKFQHPEQLTWREVSIDVTKYPTRAVARTKAEQALARIRRGEDFATVAREMGDGPNAKDGGLWDKTTPGSYYVVPVNQALASLSPGQPSAIIEGPSSFHIVRVESHVQAGNLTFAEVQTQIRDVLREAKESEEMQEYLDKLYRGAVITTVFKEYVPRDRRPRN